jgi:hypothetical protein
MTAAIDEFVQLTKRTQEALTAAVQAWQESARAAVSTSDSPQSRLPDVRATVDAAFAFASRVLADQLEFAKALVSVGATSAVAVEDEAPEQRRRASATSTAPPALPSPTTAALPAAPSRQAAPVGDVAAPRTGTEATPQDREPAPQPDAAEPARSAEAPERIDDSTRTAGERVAASERLPAPPTGTRTASGKRSAPASSPAAAASTATAKKTTASKSAAAAKKTTAPKKTGNSGS